MKDLFIATLTICCMTLMILLLYIVEIGDRRLNIVVIEGYRARGPAQDEPTQAESVGSTVHTTNTSHVAPLSFHHYADKVELAGAYADFRNGTPQIRITGFCHRNFRRALYCKYKQGAYRAFGKWINYSNASESYWRAVYFTCDVPSLEPIDHIVVGNRNDALNDVTMPVHGGDNSRDAKEFLGVCVKSGYGSPDPVRFVEWMELNRLLGVNHVVIYNASMTGDTNRVFDYYVKNGGLTVVPDNFRTELELHNPSFKNIFANFDATYSTGNEPHPQTQLLSLQDCLHVFRSKFEYILVIDIDEVLVPTEVQTLPQMIEKLKNSYPLSSAFSFLATEYLEQYGASNPSGPNFTHTLKYTRHSRLSYEQVKTIHHTRDTAEINWHKRLVPAANFTAVSHKHGWLHHYRTKCKGRSCSVSKPIDDGVHRLGRYAAALSKSVLATLESLQLVR